MNERWKPSVTVAAIASRVRGGRTEYLLVEEETPEGLKINNPAGHLDPGESPQQGVVREALEETARVFEPTHLVGIYLTRLRRAATKEDITYLRFAFAGVAGEPDPGRALDAGIVRTLWLTLDELRACRERHRSPLLLRCIEDAAAGRALPLETIFTDPSVNGTPDHAA
jgi:8-oxo-dGTP pyrophosphatase MutT (NUDIX family)